MESFTQTPRILAYIIRHRYHFKQGRNETKKALPGRPKVTVEVTKQNMSPDLVLLQGQHCCWVSYN